jgi:puromycin-sensitive aminopeptidase
MPADDYRLPTGISPNHYKLALTPDLEACTFEGTVAIEVSITEPAAEIVFNAAELEIGQTTVVDSTGATHVGTVTTDEKLERATVTFPNAFSAGDATLHVAYTGRINDDLRGFYRSTFTDAEGQQRVIATTQFESTDARRAFPCWDEPECKATFDVRMFVPDGLMGLSNGPVVAEEKADGGTWVTFGTTMKMSTYLVAFIVGPLVATPAVDVDSVPLRVACVPGRERLADFALEVGAHALRFFASYFDLPYPAGKLDLVALPDFAFGAMENLGCVTFRETALLVDSEQASRLELERIADVVSHEIAHMWFGDLVTMKWWNGIWLNEAFATFMEIAAVDAFRPSWKRWVSFSTERSAAMSTDGLASTRPIEYEVVSPEEAQGMFDVLTYQKGGAVLRMLEMFLGQSAFRDGIRLYLRQHAYANTETTDLWDALEEASGQPVRAIMDSWIFQGGHPLVSVDASDAGGITLSQKRFRYLADPSDADARWEVPVLLRSASGASSVLLTDASVAIEGGPYVVNAGGWGVFRTRYSDPLFASLLDSLSELDPIERFNLVSDTWAAAVAGSVPVDAFLDLVALLGDERDPSVWDTVTGGLDVVHRIAPSEGLRVWIRGIIEPLFTSLGWSPVEGEDEQVTRLRGSLLGALGTIGESRSVVARAIESFDAGLTDLSPDLWSSVVSTVAWNGDPAHYEVFWDRIHNATTPQDEVRYLWRIGMFPSTALLMRTLDSVLTEIRSQNGAFIITTGLANRAAGREAWEWLTANWDAVLKRLPENVHGRMLDGLVRLIDPASVVDVPAFLHDHPIPSARKQVDQLLERQKVNARFAAAAAPLLAKRF